ncbi:MAG: hypothetical protein H0V26_00445 [Solirubrobacterales bacterium]|nr:hypothetical protein [Solirubrobacterales bacterium]
MVTCTRHDAFGDLPLEAWVETKETLHRFVQMVGKIRLAASFPANHGWNVPLYLTSTGLAAADWDRAATICGHAYAQAARRPGPGR